jgi:hypothetical protein
MLNSISVMAYCGEAAVTPKAWPAVPASSTKLPAGAKTFPEKLEELIEPQEHVRLMAQSTELSMKNIGPHYLVIPFMLYNLEPGPRSMLASGIPSEMTEQLIPVVWKDQWAPMKPFLLE